jgi:hypothetical protein
VCSSDLKPKQSRRARRGAIRLKVGAEGAVADNRGEVIRSDGRRNTGIGQKRAAQNL